MSVPLTHPLSLFVHEQMVPIIKAVADEQYDGNVSEFIRLTIYAELVIQGKIPISTIAELG